MKRCELGLNYGGLMRCCTASFAQWVEENPDKEATPGERVPCNYERKDTMLVEKTGRYVAWAGV